MAIPEAQLSTWANLPRTDVASATYKAVQDAICGRDDLGIPRSDVRVYLQGSYANATNTHNDHDVDIVVELVSSATTDYGHVPNSIAVADAASRWPTPWNEQRLHPLIVSALSDRFGAGNVQIGHKAIKVAGIPGTRLSSDVVVCQRHRRLGWSPLTGAVEHLGISFHERPTGRLIVNFPAQHKLNGTAKHVRTRERFKSTVRVFKNARRYMIDRGRLPKGCAPSYFLQGLLYNVDDGMFGGSEKVNFQAVYGWLLERATSMEAFVCQNGLVPLFGDAPEQWDILEAQRFIVALTRLDRDWC